MPRPEYVALRAGYVTATNRIRLTKAATDPTAISIRAAASGTTVCALQKITSPAPLSRLPRMATRRAPIASVSNPTGNQTAR